jgi:hypothetical protein
VRSAATAPDLSPSGYAGLMPNHAAPDRAVLVPYDSSWGPRGIALAQQLRIMLAHRQYAILGMAPKPMFGFVAPPISDSRCSSLLVLRPSRGVTSYARFKQALAQSVVDVDTYAEVKDPVVDLVIAVAESWARGTGWAPQGISPDR